MLSRADETTTNRQMRWSCAIAEWPEAGCAHQGQRRVRETVGAERDRPGCLHSARESAAVFGSACKTLCLLLCVASARVAVWCQEPSWGIGCGRFCMRACRRVCSAQGAVCNSNRRQGRRAGAPGRGDGSTAAAGPHCQRLPVTGPRELRKASRCCPEHARAATEERNDVTAAAA